MALDPQRLLHGDLFTSQDFASDATPEPTLHRVGPYEVVAELARGGMGLVLVARDPALRREVAIKLLHANRFSDEAARARFMREAEALARLNHPHVVRVHAAGVERGRPYLVLELVAGESLETRLERGPLSSAETRALGVALADALAQAHARGIVHRDLKPGNVILGEDGAPRLTDFGLALPLDAEGRLSQTGQLLGTPGFWAPEQLGGPLDGVGPWTDVYGLGATLFAAVTGACPFEGDTLVELASQAMQGNVRRPRALVPDVDRRLEAVLMRCLAVDPAARYPDMRALEDALTQAAAAPPRPVWGRALAGAGVALALGIGGAWWGRGAASADPAPPAATTPPAAPHPVDPIARCLALPRPDEAALAAAEAALLAAARAGRAVDPERFAGLERGPVRWRLRTLALLVAGQGETARAELTPHDHPLARDLRFLVELGLDAGRVDLDAPRRGFGATLGSDEELAALLTQAERAPAGEPLAAVRRWALTACQRGLAQLAVRVRDGVRRGASLPALPAGWESRTLALAPGSSVVEQVEVAAAYVRAIWAHVPQEQLERDLVRLCALLEGGSLPPIWAFLAAVVVMDAESVSWAARLRAIERGVASGVALDLPGQERYQRHMGRLREQRAHLYQLEAFARRSRGEDPGEALVLAVQLGWEATLWQRHGTAGFMRQPTARLASDASVAQVQAALADGIINPHGLPTMIGTLILAGRLDLVRVLLDGDTAWADAHVLDMLEAELCLVQGRPAQAQALLEPLVADPAFVTAEAWVALAHALALQGQDAAAEGALARADPRLRRLPIPWHDPARGADLLAGRAWWPGA